MDKHFKGLLTVVLMVAFAATASAGRYNTGDAGLDQSLEGVEQAAKQNLGEYKRSLGASFGMPPETVDWMLNKQGMGPADAYMAAKVARTSGRPVTDVVEAWKASSGQGWGAVARQMGIKPGSAEFKALKAGGDGIMQGQGKGDDVKGKGKGKGGDDVKGKGKGKGGDDVKGGGKGKGKGKK